MTTAATGATTMTTMTTRATTETGRRRRVAGTRLRIVGWTVALLAAATIATVLLQRAVLLRRLDAAVTAGLEQERQELAVLVEGSDPETGEPFGDDVRAVFDTFLARNLPLDGEAFFTFVDGRAYHSTPAPVRLDLVPEVAARWADLGPAGETGELSTEAGEVRYLAVPVRHGGATAGVFVVANFTEGERREVEGVIRVSLVLAGVLLLAGTAAAWLVAGRILRPVRQLTDTARAITDTDLTGRIPVRGDDELAELARTFNAMLDRLAAAFATQRAFVDDAGHELRTPITIVRGHLELLGDDPDERRETVALVTDELDRMARIVDDLLVLAKAEQPDFARPRPVELSDLTTELLAKARALGDRTWRLDACAEGEARVDEQRVAQAVLNLARNAVEHTRPGEEVAIGSALADGSVRVWVRDGGPGVAPEDRERIFERFARGRERRASDGAGLGLSIVRAVADAHGGRVELDSRPGHGATFTLVLPRS